MQGVGTTSWLLAVASSFQGNRPGGALVIPGPGTNSRPGPGGFSLICLKQPSSQGEGRPLQSKPGREPALNP